MDGMLKDQARPTAVLDSLTSWRVLALVTMAYSLAYVDRQMLNLLVDPIRRSLSVSDTQFSFIQGSAFVGAYLLATPVFGRLVDTANRRNILILGVCIWSICTALCGMAHTYLPLFSARFGVGICEACVLPVAWSLIGDYFSPQRLPRAMSIFALGTHLGGGISFVAGGAVIVAAGDLRTMVPGFANLQAWQMAFIVVGIVGGLFLTPLLLAALTEPARRAATKDVPADQPIALRRTIEYFWLRRAFYARMFGMIGANGILNLCIPAWFPSFMIRAHHMPASVTGYRVGAVSLIGGAAGLLIGPIASQWLWKRGHIDTPLRFAAFATIGQFVFCLLIPLVRSDAAALAMAGAALFCVGLPAAIVSSSLQLATPARMRGLAGSCYTFSAQVFGYALGPTLVALLTDHVFHDPAMVGFSLQIVTCCAAIVAGTLLFTVLPQHRRMLAESPGAIS